LCSDNVDMGSRDGLTGKIDDTFVSVPHDVLEELGVKGDI